jgi:hypothetical protein
MLTDEKQTQLRVEAERLADCLYENVKLSQPMGGSPAERFDQQDFFGDQVIQALSQRVTAARVRNAQLLREAS